MKWKKGEIVKCEGRLMHQIQIEPGVTWRRHLDQIASNSTHFNCEGEDCYIICLGSVYLYKITCSYF